MSDWTNSIESVRSEPTYKRNDEHFVVELDALQTMEALPSRSDAHYR
jgi:hypothetical protein